VVNRGVLGSLFSGICAFHKLGSKSTRTWFINGVLAKSIEAGLPKNIGSEKAACANSDELFIITAAD
jgi:hypothetical protein